MSISDTFENAILNKVFKNVDFSVTASYVSLHSANPGETGANEISATGAYVRQGVVFTTGVAGAIENTGNVAFTQMMPSGTITHVGLWRHQTSTAAVDHMWNGALTASKNVNQGDTFQIGAADLDVSLD